MTLAKSHRRMGLVAIVLLIVTGSVGVNAQNTAGSQWEDAYFRVPFQHNGEWLPANMYLRITLRRVDRSLEELSANSQSLSQQDVAFTKLIGAIQSNDAGAARAVIYGFGKTLSTNEMEVGIERFSRSLAILQSPRLMYVVPMVDGGLYVVTAIDERSNKPTVITYRITERANGSYGYAVGRSYEEFAAIIVRVFMGGAARPDLYSELTVEEVMNSGVNYGLSFVPTDDQQKMGIASPFELLLNATAIDVPFLGEPPPGLAIPAPLAFYREAFSAVAADPMQAGLNKYFDDYTVGQTQEGARLLASEGGPTMKELLEQRNIKLFVDADPLWVVMHVQRNDDPSVRVEEIFRTDFVVRNGVSNFEIVQVFALPLLKTLFQTEFVQRTSLQRISAGEEVTVGSSVRKIEAFHAPSRSFGNSWLVGLAILILGGIAAVFKSRQT